jgi:hypothetical protein
LADAEFKIEKEKHKEKEANEPKKGWFSRWMGGSETQETTNVYEITEEQRQELYNQIGYNAEEVVQTLTVILQHIYANQV